MNLRTVIPKPEAIASEIVVVLLGALGAALIVGQLPAVKTWMREQWAGTPPGSSPFSS